MPTYNAIKSTDPKCDAKLRYFEKRALLAKVCNSTEARLSVHTVYSELCEAEREAFGSVAMPGNPHKEIIDCEDCEGSGCEECKNTGKVEAVVTRVVPCAACGRLIEDPANCPHCAKPGPGK